MQPETQSIHSDIYWVKYLLAPATLTCPGARKFLQKMWKQQQPQEQKLLRLSLALLPISASSLQCLDDSPATNKLAVHPAWNDFLNLHPLSEAEKKKTTLPVYCASKELPVTPGWLEKKAGYGFVLLTLWICFAASSGCLFASFSFS